MDKRARARHLLAELGDTLNIERLTLEESDTTCVLFFEGDVVLNIEFDDDSGCLVLSSYLGELPEQNDEPLLRELLAANFHKHRTQGATLGLEEATGGVILCHAQDVGEVDRLGFEALIETFVEQAEKWSRHIAEGGRRGRGYGHGAVRGRTGRKCQPGHLRLIRRGNAWTSVHGPSNCWPNWARHSRSSR